MDGSGGTGLGWGARRGDKKCVWLIHFFESFPNPGAGSETWQGANWLARSNGGKPPGGLVRLGYSAVAEGFWTLPPDHGRLVYLIIAPALQLGGGGAISFGMKSSRSWV